MKNLTCAVDGCANPQASRSMCRRHYGIEYRAGRLAPITQSPRHYLSHVDTNEATATCAVCGPVEIRVRRDGKSHECMILRRANRGRGGSYEHLKHKYGLTDGDYLEMFEAQGGLCAICSRPPEPEKLFVDHDHATGLVRQLLCRHCNSALGFLRDDVDTARAAIEYLKRHSAA